MGTIPNTAAIYVRRSAAPRHSKTPTKARSQRAKPAPPVAFTTRKTVIGSNAPRNAPPSPS
jgi:hypothetical protein